MLSVSLLGDFCIRHDEKPVTDIDTPRLQSLLTYLLLHRDAPQSRAQLAFLFWPDTSEAQAHTNLRNLLHQLRQVLPDPDSHLDIKVQTLQWRCDTPYYLDVADFENVLVRVEQAGKIHNLPAARHALEQASAIYKGDLLPGCYDDWIIPYREGLRQSYLDALEQLVGILEEQRDYPAAITYAQLILRCDALHEAAYRRLIRLFALNDDRASALRIYHTCATVLQRELGVDPAAATKEAYERILGDENKPSSTVQTSKSFSPLVGRQEEWAQVLKAWRDVSSGGEPRVVMLSGEAGIGKTRLVEELLQWATRQGIACASARCFAAEGDLAFAPVTTWLRTFPLVPLESVWLAEVARLLPEVLDQRPDLPKPASLIEAWQRKRLFEALSRAILGINPLLLLIIDDLQWCDRDTLEWLHFLMRFDRKARLLVVGAYRPEEIGEDHPLVTSLQALRLEGLVTEVDLGPLDEAATQTLATLVAGVKISPETSQFLYRETEGNPLFVVETVRAGLPVHNQRVNAGLPGGSLPGDGNLPPRVQLVLEARLTQVSPPAQELACLAATIGREFSFKLLARASTHDEDTLVHELDELWRRRIVREHGLDAYDFSHDKLREVAYDGMSAARRRLLHGHVARALETLHAEELDPVSHQVATHYEGAGLPDQAIPYYLRAAGVARQVYANEEAIALLKRGLALVADRMPGTDKNEDSHELVAQLWEALADILELKAQHEEALQAYQNAQAQLPDTNRLGRARLHRKTGAAMREQRRYAEALDACHRAEIALGRQPDEDASPWWDEWIDVQVDQVWAHYWLAQWPEMEMLVRKVQPVMQEHGRVTSRVQFLMASCLMNLRKGRYVVSDEMLAYSREAYAASLEWGSLKTRIECQFELGFLHLWRREFEEAEENLQASLELTESSGNLPLQTLSLTYLTVLRRFRGQMDEVSNYVLQAQEAAIAAHMPDYVAAAKANQSWLAWRRQDLPTAEQRSREALALWQQSPLVYPFQWQALFPLIAVALTQDREVEAWAYAQELLEPKQQHLPDGLKTALEEAVQAKVKGQAGVASFQLDRAMELAREMGYL